MTKQTINIGTLPGDGTGDPIRVGFDKTNDNFVELYANVAALLSGNQIVYTTGAVDSVAGKTGNVILGVSDISGAASISYVTNAVASAAGYSGYSGISGWSGTLPGVSGYSGASGRSGYSGTRGFSGYSGNNGINGASGYSGISGFSGTLPGVSGYSGTSGYSGISGFSGTLPGVSGYSGTSGYSGISGFSGYSGTVGIGFVSPVPTTSKGLAGDLAGSTAIDSNYIYYCSTTWTNGIADIWSRTALSPVSTW